MANAGQVNGAMPTGQQGGNPNVYGQSAQAFNSAMTGTQAAYGQAMGAPAAQGSASTYQAMGAPAAQGSASTYQAAQMAPARQLADTSLDPYMNPYTSGVIDQNAADMERARLMQQGQGNAAAQAAGAFGGSRHGVMAAETNRGFYDRLGAMSGQLRNQGYQNAQGAAFQDIGNEIGVNQFNASARNNAMSQNAQLGTQASLQNAGMQNNANQFSASAQNNAMSQNAQLGTQASLQNAGMQNQQSNQQFGNMLAASGQMAGLADQGFGFGTELDDRAMRDGQMSRQIQQQLIDAAKQQYGSFANSGNLGLSPLAAFTGGNFGQTQTQTQDPGLLGTIGSAATAAGSIAKAAPAIATMFAGCWVAREVYGPLNPEWVDFRQWLFTKAPAWLRKGYMKHGPRIAAWVKRNQWSKRILRPVMDWLKG